MAKEKTGSKISGYEIVCPVVVSDRKQIKKEDAENVKLSASYCIQAISKTINTFGDFSYSYKGPETVMNIPSFSAAFGQMPPEDVGSILSQVLDCDIGEPFVECILLVLTEEKGSHWVKTVSNQDSRFKKYLK